MTRQSQQRGAKVCLAMVLAACSAETEPMEAGSSTSGGEGSTSPMAASTGDGADGSTTTGPGPADGTDTGEASNGSTGTPSETSTGATGGASSSSGGMDDGLGVISGMCGAIAADDLTGPSPAVFVNAIDFGDVGFDENLLTEGGQQIYDDGNLGGNSLLSEIIAYEVLARCEQATLLKTETEIVYDDPMGTKTDLLVEMAELDIGVSVTRAIAFPFEDPYEVATAAELLEDKLLGVLESSANVAAEDAWTKQILHIVAYGPMHAESLQTAYEGLTPELQADTIVVITVTNGDDAFIYE